MFIEGCARLVVLLLLVSSSFSRSLDDTLGTLDAALDDPIRTSAQHRSVGEVGGRVQRWHTAREEGVEHDIAAAVGDEQRIDEEGLEGVNATSGVKESKHLFGPHPPYSFCIPQYLFQGASTTAAPSITFSSTAICQQLATNAGITGSAALQTYLQQCAGLLSLISGNQTTGPTTTAAPTTTPPVTTTCLSLAASAGITAPAALQAYLQQCALLLGLITTPTTAAPTTTGPTTTAAPTTTPPITSTCQFLAATAGITAPAALQAYLQQCALLLGLITAPTTAAPTTTGPTTTAAANITAATTTTAGPTTTPPITVTCQLLASTAGITAPAALQTYLQQCAVLLGLVAG